MTKGLQVQYWKVKTFSFFTLLFSFFFTSADTITKVDTMKYGEDSLVIEKSVSIVDTFNMASNNVEMADTLRSNGKIYIVVLVLLIVLAGILTFLISIDRRVKSLEDNKE